MASAGLESATGFIVFDWYTSTAVTTFLLRHIDRNCPSHQRPVSLHKVYLFFYVHKISLFQTDFSFTTSLAWTRNVYFLSNLSVLSTCMETKAFVGSIPVFLQGRSPEANTLNDFFLSSGNGTKDVISK